ncbi:MAG: hypothetical protein K0S32_881 [Bacteroidetes bacterium]|nr:hypothetical protein [Bacteroidota bacterium]
MLSFFALQLCFSQPKTMNYLTPECFHKVNQFIHAQGDSVTMNISSRTDKFDPITYHVIKRNGVEIQVYDSDRIYFSKDRVHLGNMLMLFHKTVEPEIPESENEKENEKSVLKEYNLLAEEVLKSRK